VCVCFFFTVQPDCTYGNVKSRDLSNLNFWYKFINVLDNIIFSIIQPFSVFIRSHS